MSRTHELKCWPSHFEAIRRGDKTCEVRENDRDFAVGDIIKLREYDPVTKEYFYRGVVQTTMQLQITHILEGGQWGLKDGYCVISFKKLEASHE